MNEKLQKIPCDSISLGAMFSEPVYFDDGENMFLAPYKTAKEYHLAVIKRWSVPFLLTAGHKMSVEEIAELSQKQAEENAKKEVESAETVEELDEVEEIEEVDEVSDLEELSEFEDL